MRRTAHEGSAAHSLMTCCSASSSRRSKCSFCAAAPTECTAQGMQASKHSGATGPSTVHSTRPKQACPTNIKYPEDPVVTWQCHSQTGKCISARWALPAAVTARPRSTGTSYTDCKQAFTLLEARRPWQLCAVAANSVTAQFREGSACKVTHSAP